jgi:hypothetical protein
MWARVAELMLGAWLMISPLVFRGTASADSFVMRDLSCGAAVIALSLLSFWTRTGWAHLITAALAVALGLMGYLGSDRPGPPAAQNEIMIGMLLLLLAIVPNEANQPPPAWRRFPG